MTSADEVFGRHTAIELVHRCGRLPLALRIAATRLAYEPDLTVADLVARMAAGNPLDALSYDDLSVRDRLTADLAALATENALTVAALRALGRLPAQGVPAAQVATLINVSTPAVQAALDALVDARIVSRHADRYRLPLLSRAYAGVPLDGAVGPFGGQASGDTPAPPGADRASVVPVGDRPNEPRARRGCAAGPRPEPALATTVTRAASARD